MTPEKRAALASKIVDAVRRNIEFNGGRYTGAMAPNLQSVQDILMLPDEYIERELPQWALRYTYARVSETEEQAVAAAWRDENFAAAMPADQSAPLFMLRTWAGSYVEPARWHLALLGWCRYWLR